MSQKLPPPSRRRPATLPKSPQAPPPKKRRKDATPPKEPEHPVAAPESYVDGAPDGDRIAAFAARRAQKPLVPPRPHAAGHPPASLGPAPSRRSSLAAFLNDDEDGNDNLP